jgi:hypothetical protein
MKRPYDSMLRATDPASIEEALREFIAEAKNIQDHLNGIADACELEAAEQHA